MKGAARRAEPGCEKANGNPTVATHHRETNDTAEHSDQPGREAARRQPWRCVHDGERQRAVAARACVAHAERRIRVTRDKGTHSDKGGAAACERMLVRSADERVPHASFRMERATPFDPTAFRHVRACEMPTMAPADGVRTGAAPPRSDARHWILLSLLCASVCVGVSFLVFFGAVYTNLSDEIATVRDGARPYVHRALNHTMHILNNADASSADMATAVADVAALTHDTVPAMERALNQTSAIVARLEALAAHPVLQVSLGQQPVR